METAATPITTAKKSTAAPIDTLRATAAKLTTDKKFIAYWLFTYSHTKTITREKMMELLKCSQEAYYKTASFEIPLVDNGGALYLSKTRLNEICMTTSMDYNSLYEVLEQTIKTQTHA